MSHKQASTRTLGSTVTGSVFEHAFVPPQSIAWSPSLPATNQGDVVLAPNTTRTLAPGSFFRVTVNAGAVLTLGSGVYFLDSLTLEPSSRVVLQGQVELLVRSSLIDRGTFSDAGGAFPALLLGYFGTTAASIEAPFTGTLIAPNGLLRLANVGSARHRGVFFGKQVEVQAGVNVDFVAPAAFGP